MGVLDELVDRARRRAVGLESNGLESARPHPDFRAALAGRERIQVIAEFKRRSPSLGNIREHADIARQVASYVDGGAAAVSVLTEPSRFGGSYEDLRTAVEAIDVPVLMKDFVVAPQQVELAASLGASAVLLIVRCLSNPQLHELALVCARVGLTPLIECHDESEIRDALAVEDAVIGVNHRNLSTLDIDLRRGRKLLELVPPDRVVISESGIETPAQVRELRGVCDAVLIGTALMRSEDPRKFLGEALS